MVRRLLLILAVPLVISSGCALSKAQKNRALYHYQMGQSFYAENNFTSALQEFSEAEKLTPKDPVLLNDLGLTYFRKGRYDLAEGKYLKAIDLKPDYSEARNNLGVTYLEMKRWDDAIAQFKIVQNDIFYTSQDSAAINLGLGYLGKGEYPEALRVLRGAVAKNPNDPRGRLNLGRVYFAMDKTELAIEQYQKALALNNSYAAAHYNLGLALMKQKQNRAARDAFKEVVRIAPDSEMGQLSREYLDLLK
ncbi:tetratricopeptide repeat protein [Geomonas sp.]|uniref:tetratricopeptide repeat protein n=1 Tax=Geomonas sp. TaxID=2651584 RepID=UPI002B48DA78|nr:tetratricopeptide repeat protein [Geomonas sp.]HJV35473.1 tetratricopeptide repeat protein [Geomonas sp.]